jgi:hypothetical protein
MTSLTKIDPERQARIHNAAVDRAWQIATLISRALDGDPLDQIRQYLKLDQDEFDSLRYVARGVGSKPWHDSVCGVEAEASSVRIEVKSPLKVVLVEAD